MVAFNLPQLQLSDMGSLKLLLLKLLLANLSNRSLHHLSRNCIKYLLNIYKAHILLLLLISTFLLYSSQFEPSVCCSSAWAQIKTPLISSFTNVQIFLFNTLSTFFKACSQRFYFLGCDAILHVTICFEDGHKTLVCTPFHPTQAGKATSPH